MRTGIYLRISEDRTGEELGVTRQRDDAVALADRRGWTVAEHYTENDTSAAGHNARPEFARMIKDIKADKLDVIIGWTWDRLTRTARDKLEFIEVGREHQIIVVLVRGSEMDLGTPAGRLTAGVLAEVAQHEIDAKGDRHRSANDQAARAGKPPGGPVPFGFMPDRITHHPDQAAAIARGYDELLEGVSLAGIARRWNAAGLLSGRVRTGARGRGTASLWRAETVRVLLLNARNAGIRVHKGAEYPAKWAPIVSEETYRAAVELLRDPGRRVAPPSAKRLLSGVALCGVCGSRLNAGMSRRTQNGQIYFAYRCRSSLGHVGRRGDTIDDLVTVVILDRLARRDAVGLLRSKNPDLDVAALRRTARALRARSESVAADFADLSMTPAQFRTFNLTLQAQIADAERQLTDAGRVDILAPLVGHGSVEKVAEAWFGTGPGTGLDPDVRRAVIDSLAWVVVYPAGRGARTFDPESVWIRFRTDI